MVDASTVDCNAKEDDDEPGGEMCTDTTRTHFGLGPSSHTRTQRSSYYSLLFALAATILLLSPLLLRIATRPLAESGALCLLRFGEIASGRQRVPATTNCFEWEQGRRGNRGTAEPFRARTSASQTRSITASRSCCDLMTGTGRCRHSRKVVIPRTRMTCRRCWNAVKQRRRTTRTATLKMIPRCPKLLSVSDSDEENESDTIPVFPALRALPHIVLNFSPPRPRWDCSEY
ncbi:hypothetical protein B0H14DRAFT_1575738 [Mycena olivaceomarginata]|nr:hypothetical protein B0H14DRAFT_1575738 [Mycena olivaceomarginata]